VIFLVLIAIQYVVINHGAVRISEVTARFTLDALPGKQMSIDADLNAGLIDENEAKQRRKPWPRKRSSTAPWTAPPASPSGTPSPAS
jgi:flagellar biosynthesis protein FlhA